METTQKQTIFVITHDGSETKFGGIGGQRISYQCGDTLFCIGTGLTYSVSALLAAVKPAQAPAPAAPPEKPKVLYFKLFPYKKWRGCYKCNGDNVRRQSVATDIGLEMLNVCENCGEVMR